jgi:hypothetical protein
MAGSVGIGNDGEWKGMQQKRGQPREAMTWSNRRCGQVRLHDLGLRARIEAHLEAWEYIRAM